MPVSDAPAPASPRWTLTQWLVVTLASIGFAFDIYELLVLPLVAGPAITELTGAKPNTPEFGLYLGQLFYIPAFAGGVFGLLGGYLTDLLGRRRVLTWSILLYAVSAFAAGCSTSFSALLFFRCTTFIGVCVEFVAAVAWLAELFPEPTTREHVLGYTQAFSSFGGLLVGAANRLAIAIAASLPAVMLPEFLGTVADPHAPWRYTLMSGLLPALPLIVIRPFLPESPAWQQKKQAGSLKRPSIAELFAPAYLRTTIVTTIMFACSYGAAFGAIQQLPQIVPGLPEVKESMAGKTPPEQGKIRQAAAAEVSLVQEVGGLVGRFVLAALAAYIVSRRTLLRIFQVPGLVLIPGIFAFAILSSLPLAQAGAFLAGFFTVAQFSFWGNYLPRVYPVHLRGTGESFAANIGGRMIGTSFAAVTAFLATSTWAPGGDQPTKYAYAAAGVALFVYAVGSIACFFLPEPKGEDLPD